MYKQACQVTVVSHGGVRHAGTLRPRLDSSAALAGALAARLEGRLRHLERINDALLDGSGYGGGGGGDPRRPGRSLEEERLIRLAITSLDMIRDRISGVSLMSAIPQALAPAIPVARTLSSGLFDPVPECSRQMCELSAGLGSIVADSAVLTSARCDFGSFNAESARLLDGAKLTADSEMYERHPNLRTAETGST